MYFFTNFWLFGEFLQKLMSCWRSYCAVGVPADANNVVAGLPSAVDAVMFILSQLLWPPSMLLPSSLFLQGSLLLIAPILLLLSFLLLLVSWCCWRSCCYWLSCCWRRSCCCYSFPADPDVPILAGGFVEWEVSHYRPIGLLEYGYRTVIFSCYQTIRISNTLSANSRNYRTINIGSRPQSIGLLDIGLGKNYRLPTSDNSDQRTDAGTIYLEILTSFDLLIFIIYLT